MQVTLLSTSESLFNVVTPSPLPSFFTEAERPPYVDEFYIKAIFPANSERHDESGSHWSHYCIVKFPGVKCSAAIQAAAAGYALEIEAQSSVSLESDFSTLEFS